MPGAADRIDDGPGGGERRARRTGLARRAHADPRRDVARGPQAPRRRGVPECVRQDQLRDADPTADARRLEGDDDRRRHRVDQARQGRTPVRDQPRSRLLRRRPGHEREDQPELHGKRRSRRDLHQRRADRRRRCLVGGHERRAACAPDRLARARLDAGARARDRRQGGASERALHRRCNQQPGARCGVGFAHGRADRRLHLRRPALDDRAARHRGARLDRGRLHGGDDGLGDDRRRCRQAGSRPPRSVRHAALHGLQHERVLPSLARPRRDPRTLGHEAAEDLLRQLVPPRPRRQVRLAGLRREHARAALDRRARRRPRRRRAERVRHHAALPRPRLVGSRLRRRSLRPRQQRRRGRVAARARAPRRAVPSARASLAARAARGAAAARRAAGQPTTIASLADAAVRARRARAATVAR